LRYLKIIERNSNLISAMKASLEGKSPLTTTTKASKPEDLVRLYNLLLQV